MLSAQRARRTQVDGGSERAEKGEEEGGAGSRGQRQAKWTGAVSEPQLPPSAAAPLVHSCCCCLSPAGYDSPRRNRQVKRKQSALSAAYLCSSSPPSAADPPSQPPAAESVALSVTSAATHAPTIHLQQFDGPLIALAQLHSASIRRQPLPFVHSRRDERRRQPQRQHPQTRGGGGRRHSADCTERSV